MFFGNEVILIQHYLGRYQMHVIFKFEFLRVFSTQNNVSDILN